MRTPWGASQTVEDIGKGILAVSTAGHGGYYVPLELHATMPEPYQQTFAGGRWYEEDCDWAKVVLSFPELFTLAQREAAKQTAMRWFLEAYNAVERSKNGIA